MIERLGVEDRDSGGLGVRGNEGVEIAGFINTKQLRGLCLVQDIIELTNDLGSYVCASSVALGDKRSSVAIAITLTLSSISMSDLDVKLPDKIINPRFRYRTLLVSGDPVIINQLNTPRPKYTCSQGRPIRSI